MMIIDTREQSPLWDISEFKVLRQKLDEGDYTISELFGKAHAERKSAIDLYGSLIKGSERFQREIQRAIDKDLKLAVFVECSENKFVNMKFKGASRLKVNPEVLGKIVRAFKSQYPIDFIWCNGREDMKDKMCIWFAKEMMGLNK